MEEVVLEALRPMSAEEIKVVSFIEHKWHQTGDFPTLSEFYEISPRFDLNKSLKKTAFVNALVNRGIDLPGLSHNDSLTNEQVAAVTLLTNWEDRRPRHVKLRSLGISPTKWNGWLRSSKFKAFLHSLSSKNLDDSVYAVEEGLLKAADRGDVNAIKFYMEITGRYEGSSPEVRNLKLVLSRLTEVIQKHVRDPALLQSINMDFQRAMRGESIEETASPSIVRATIESI